MKKILFVAALLLAALTTKAEVIAKDTVAYAGESRVEKIEKTNDYGEVSVRYVAYLLDVTNSKGEPRKVTTDRATYESGAVTHLVYNTQDSGTKKIAKAINLDAVNAKKREIADAKK